MVARYKHWLLVTKPTARSVEKAPIPSCLPRPPGFGLLDRDHFRPWYSLGLTTTWKVGWAHTSCSFLHIIDSLVPFLAGDLVLLPAMPLLNEQQIKTLPADIQSEQNAETRKEYYEAARRTVDGHLFRACVIDTSINGTASTRLSPGENARLGVLYRIVL
jgi:hypothetical protein